MSLPPLQRAIVEDSLGLIDAIALPLRRPDRELAARRGQPGRGGGEVVVFRAGGAAAVNVEGRQPQPE